MCSVMSPFSRMTLPETQTIRFPKEFYNQTTLVTHTPWVTMPSVIIYGYLHAHMVNGRPLDSMGCYIICGSKKTAKDHVDEQTRPRFPCPDAKKPGCEKTFSSKGMQICLQRGRMTRSNGLVPWKTRTDAPRHLFPNTRQKHTQRGSMVIRVLPAPDSLAHAQNISGVRRRLPRVKVPIGMLKMCMTESNGRVPWQRNKAARWNSLIKAIPNAIWRLSMEIRQGERHIAPP